jgi:hypothetical protein
MMKRLFVTQTILKYKDSLIVKDKFIHFNSTLTD